MVLFTSDFNMFKLSFNNHNIIITYIIFVTALIRWPVKCVGNVVTTACT